VSEDTTTTAAPAMKLSEAIRAGAVKCPQTTGTYYRDGATCALGAAYEGAFGQMPATGYLSVYERLVALFPALRTPYDGDGDSESWDLRDAIMHRNDSLGWTREQIADWLESQGL
jgi:hypothetical protein